MRPDEPPFAPLRHPLGPERSRNGQQQAAANRVARIVRICGRGGQAPEPRRLDIEEHAVRGQRRVAPQDASHDDPDGDVLGRRSALTGRLDPCIAGHRFKGQTKRRSPCGLPFALGKCRAPRREAAGDRQHERSGSSQSKRDDAPDQEDAKRGETNQARWGRRQADRGSRDQPSRRNGRDDAHAGQVLQSAGHPSRRRGRLAKVRPGERDPGEAACWKEAIRRRSGRFVPRGQTERAAIPAW